jgi:hypothetical protein
VFDAVSRVRNGTALFHTDKDKQIIAEHSQLGHCQTYSNLVLAECTLSPASCGQLSDRIMLYVYLYVQPSRGTTFFSLTFRTSLNKIIVLHLYNRRFWRGFALLSRMISSHIMGCAGGQGCYGGYTQIEIHRHNERRQQGLSLIFGIHVWRCCQL